MIVDSVKRIWPFLNQKRKKQLVLILVLMILSSFSEIISIGSVIPFLGVLISPEKIFENETIIPLLDFFEINNNDQLIPVFTFLFVFAAIFSGTVRFMLLWFQKRVGHGIGSDLSIDIFNKTLHQSYITYLNKNSSQLISGISTKISVVTGNTLLPILQLLSSSFIILSILLILIIVDPIISLITFFAFGIIYSVILILTKKQITSNSLKISKSADKLIKVIQEGLGGIRDILIDGTQKEFCKSYREADLPLRLSKANNEIISGMPKFLIETLGIILIALVAYMSSLTENGLIDSIPVLGALAIGAQRLLPLLQQFYASITMIKGEKASFYDVLDLLNQPLNNHSEKSVKKIDFVNKIEFKNIAFKYDKLNNNVLEDINLIIKRGERVGLIGSTGSGKSTLLDLLMGLLHPTQGQLIVDSIEIDETNFTHWQKNIAHVPQSIYLSDASVNENIAFGIPKEKINHERVIEVCKQAQIFDFINNLPKKFETTVGERGVKFSGGQRQRLGIARALYKSARLIVFDEATSALDEDTEVEVMNSINSLENNVTMFIVAHRTSTLKQCDKIIKIENGNIQKILNYNEI